MRYLIIAMLVAIFASNAALADETAVFKSPSGNIYCMMSVGDWNGARCDIRNFTASYTDPTCELDFGYAFEVEATGPGYPICAGDTVNDGSNAVLNYGQQLTYGAITCVSAQRGMTCSNPDGHGFFMSRAHQEVF